MHNVHILQNTTMQYKSNFKNQLFGHSSLNIFILWSLLINN